MLSAAMYSQISSRSKSASTLRTQRSRPRFPALGGFALETGAGFSRVDGLAAIEGRKAAAKLAIEFRQLGGAGGIVFLKKPERFADDFTRRVVAARSDLSADEFFQLRGERYVSWSKIAIWLVPAVPLKCAMPSDRQSLQALKNIIEQIELLISTTEPMPENRTPRCQELLRAAHGADY
jgi:hypothetical protein